MRHMVSNLQIKVPLPDTRQNAWRRAFRHAIGDAQLGDFHAYIHRMVETFRSREEIARHHVMLRDFEGKFDESFDRWRQLLSEFGMIPTYPGWLNDLLHLGLWDSIYTNDAAGELSPFGPWLSQLGNAMGGVRIGLVHAFEQQLAHPFQQPLQQAQMLANDLYAHLLAFLERSDITTLKPDYPHPPVVQLYGGGAVTWFKDVPVPTIIAFSLSKGHAFGGYTALPHEFGHDLSGTFQGARLVEEIKTRVAGLDIPHREFWTAWIEECFADAIGVATIREGEVFSLANLFSDYYTNIIFTDESGERPDEHPNRQMRVLLAIEVGRLLGIDSKILDQTRNEWIDFGKRKNTMFPADRIYDDFNQVLYPMSEFAQGITPVATALVDIGYSQLHGKKVRDIFDGFESDLADAMRTAVTEKKWL